MKVLSNQEHPRRTLFDRVWFEEGMRVEITTASDDRLKRIDEFFANLHKNVDRNSLNEALSLVGTPVEGPVYSLILTDESADASAWRLEIFYGDDYISISPIWQVESSPFFENHARVLRHVFSQCDVVKHEQRSAMNEAMGRHISGTDPFGDMQMEARSILAAAGCPAVADYAAAIAKVVASLRCQNQVVFQAERRIRIGEDVLLIHGNRQGMARLTADRHAAASVPHFTDNASDTASGETKKTSQIKIVPDAIQASVEEKAEPEPDNIRYTAYALDECGELVCAAASMTSLLSQGRDISPVYMALSYTSSNAISSFFEEPPSGNEAEHCSSVVTACIYAATTCALISASFGGESNAWKAAVKSCIGAAKWMGEKVVANSENATVSLPSNLFDRDVISAQLSSMAQEDEISRVRSCIQEAQLTASISKKNNPAETAAEISQMGYDEWLKYSGLSVLDSAATQDSSMSRASDADIWRAAIVLAGCERAAGELGKQSADADIKDAAEATQSALSASRNALIEVLTSEFGYDVRSACDRYGLWQLPGSMLVALA